MGGGIIGMTTARELAQRGLTVGLVDSGVLGQEASGAAGGILSSMRPWSENPDSKKLSMQGMELYEKYTEELIDQTDIDPEYYRSGLLMINEMDVSHSKRWVNDNHVSFSSSYHDYPFGMCIPETSLFLPDIAQIRVPRLLKALQASLDEFKVALYQNTKITELEISNGSCKALKSETEDFYADTFIITAGAWSQQLTGMDAEHISIKPVFGQMLCVKFPKQVLNTMVLDGAHYLIPRMDGHVLIGSTMEHTGFEKKMTKTARRKLMGWATNLWPDIKDAEFVKQWSGLRPATDNGKPYLGRLETYDNVFINAGHFRKGILQAPACARKIADMVCST